MHTRILSLSLVSLLVFGCGEITPSEDDESSDVAPAAAAPTPAAPSHVDAVAPEPAQAAPAPAAPAGGTVTLTALREGFAADQAAWMGREVTVTALYFSSTSVAGELNNIALKSDRESGANTMCAFTDETRPTPAPSLTQYHPITVTGTVGSFFGSPKIDGCRIVQ